MVDEIDDTQDELEHRRTIVAVFAKKMFAQDKRVRAERDRWRALLARGKQHGVTWAQIEDAITEFQMTNDQRSRRNFLMVETFQALGIPAQMDLFEVVEARRNDPVEEARQRGRFAAITCQSEGELPYPPGSPEGQAWLNGYRDMEALERAFDENKLAPVKEPTPAAAEDDENDGAESESDEDAGGDGDGEPAASR